MKILSIDTAHGVCSLALAENGIVVAVKTEHEPSRQAEKLFLIIEELLKENNLSYAEIKAIAVNIGPGSFTGVRIGLAAARGIALAAKIPVIGVTGFEALAHAARKNSKSDNILIVFDARREQVFSQLFTKDGNSEPLLGDYGHVISLVKDKGRFEIAGDGAGLIEPFIINNPNVYSINNALKLPDASLVSQVAFEKINSSHYEPNPAPLYIRPPDAKLPKTPFGVNIA